MSIDPTRLGVLVASGLLWSVAAAIATGGPDAAFTLLVTAYVVASSLVLSLRTHHALLPALGPWVLTAAWAVLVLVALPGPVTLGVVLLSLLYGVVIGTLLFWAWAATAMLVLRFVSEGRAGGH